MIETPFYFKFYASLLLCFLCSIGGWGQVNLVMNPSLEIYDTCPYNYDQINLANYWSSIDTFHAWQYHNESDGMPEYCNACAIGNFNTGIPINNYFMHLPRTGVGMSQVLMFYDESIQPSYYKRDYLQGRFIHNLIAGKNYCVSFYVALEQASEYAINHIGAYLDDGSIDTAINTSGYIQNQYTPQILDTSIIYDTLNWVKIEGSFTATGNEKFITIGNFSDIFHTSYVLYDSWKLTSTYSLYLVDDISVIESNTKAYAWNTDTLHKGYLDSILIGRDEIIPGIRWYRDGVLIDTLHAGIWIKDDTLGTYHTYILSQTLCGLTTYDTVVVSVELVSSGINTNALKNEILIYPNPISNELNIANATNGTSIKVYDVVGRLVYSDILNAKQESINTSAWERGAYFVELLLPDGSREVRKVLK